ncbi:hypothetical protein BURMUCF2_A1196 [Burkholderia multivorans CF2]|nr:hypothetical protein BURMUCF2_A1196 [Burkholderia multivorans CF2]
MHHAPSAPAPASTSALATHACAVPRLRTGEFSGSCSGDEFSIVLPRRCAVVPDAAFH